MAKVEYSLQITKVLNGWTVGCGQDVMVIHEDQELGGAIAAMILAEKLNPAPKLAATLTGQSCDYMQQKLGMDQANSLRNSVVGMTGISNIMKGSY